LTFDSIPLSCSCCCRSFSTAFTSDEYLLIS
jgi:hypothetical protein